MKKTFKFALLSATALVGMSLASCTAEDAIETNPNVEGETVKTAFTISFPNAIQTRMGATEVQQSGNFRGLDDFYLVPFGQAVSAGTETKLGSIITLSSFSAFDFASANAKVYSGQTVPVGTNHFLFYAKAIDAAANTAITTDAQKHQYGILDVKTGSTSGIVEASYTKVNDITFSPVQIQTSTATCGGSTKGQALITLLNNVEDATDGTTAWSTVTETANPLLYKLYQKFTALTTGSSANVRDALEDLYVSLNSMAANTSNSGYSVAKAIRDVISAACATAPAADATTIGALKDTYTGYPADILLPEGAARVTFSGGSFSWAGTEAHATQLGITALGTYVYPANLWYFANSELKTEKAVKLTAANVGSKTWAEVLSSLYGGTTAGTQVDDDTRSVVMTDQAQYAVGRLDASMVALNANPYYDKKGEVVDVTNGFTLKGILVGGQKPVDWKFQPTGSTEYTVYDNALNSGTWTIKNGTASGTNYTLLLETAANTAVNVALELVNNGNDFEGADGVIPAGGTFYLMATLTPSEGTGYNASTMNQVFKQDYNTVVTFTLGNGDNTGHGGLATATNGIPDLRTPTVELGLSVNLEWQAGLVFNKTF